MPQVVALIGFGQQRMLHGSVSGSIYCGGSGSLYCRDTDRSAEGNDFAVFPEFTDHPLPGIIIRQDQCNLWNANNAVKSSIHRQDGSHLSYSGEDFKVAIPPKRVLAIITIEFI
jgi:hypothetical protein